MTQTTSPRRLVGREVFPVGLGCMNLSHAYGVPPSRDEARALLHAALDAGITHFDTAALYGFGRNEELVGDVLSPHRERFVLASKCGMTGVNGKRTIDGRPETLKRTCKESLQRLRTDRIDLYYLHRWDKSVPIEDSVGALRDLVQDGVIGAIGLSEISAATLRRAHAVHPIAAVQSEYSLWSRASQAVLDTCREIGATFVAFSPLGRGFLAGGVRDPGHLVEGDLRRGMPRFQAPNFARNLAVLEEFEAVAREAGCTPAQLALAWLLQQANVLPLFGTTSVEHLNENVASVAVGVSPELLARAEQLVSDATIAGERYPAATFAEIDTERG
jgi:aryl-alcohol dehydrogenase-like predicted oxidoreductase